MDLVRRYDHATWNMYQRIVSARRKRLAQIDLQKMREAKEKEAVGGASLDRPSSSDRDEDSTASSAATGAVVPPSERERQGQEQQQQEQRPTLHTMHKNPSQENSTLATADETDGSSRMSLRSLPGI